MQASGQLESRSIWTFWKKKLKLLDFFLFFFLLQSRELIKTLSQTLPHSLSLCACLLFMMVSSLGRGGNDQNGGGVVFCFKELFFFLSGFLFFFLLLLSPGSKKKRCGAKKKAG